MGLKKILRKRLQKKHYYDYKIKKKFMFNWVDKKNGYY